MKIGKYFQVKEEEENEGILKDNVKIEILKIS